ncbi:MAG: regulator of sigma E protease [Arcticibacterium sp.]
MGLKTGDKILAVSGDKVEKLSDVMGSNVILGENVFFSVARGKSTLEIPIPNDLYEKISDEDSKGFIDPLQTFKVGSVSPDTPAEAVGLQAEDRIIGVNDKPVNFYHEFTAIAAENSGKEVVLSINRGSDTLTLNPTLTEDGKLGFMMSSDLAFTHQEVTLGTAFAMGSQRALSVVTDNIKGFKKIFTGQVSPGKALAGPVGIARRFYGGTWDWTRFFMITGMLSMALAFMNLLPIPALDGGHSVLLIYEMVSGRKPSEKFMERTQQVGMVILLGLLAWIMFNDTMQAIF